MTFLGKVAAILISIVFLLLIGEASTRFYVRDHKIYDLEMIRYALEVKKIEPNSKIKYIQLPLISTRLMNVPFNTNSDGLRDREFGIEHPGKFRGEFFGDSITMGWGVNNQYTFKNLLERSLSATRPVEIMNFGVANYNTAQQYQLFLDKGLKYKPNLVSVFYHLRNAKKAQDPNPFYWLGNSTLISFYWYKLRALNPIGSEKHFITFHRNLYLDDSEGWQETQQALLAWNNLSKTEEFSFNVIILPDFHQLSAYPFEHENQIVSDFLKKNNINQLNLAPFFGEVKNARELWVSTDDSHPNRIGHKLIADYSFGFLNKSLEESKF